MKCDQCILTTSIVSPTASSLHFHLTSSLVGAMMSAYKSEGRNTGQLCETNWQLGISKEAVLLTISIDNDSPYSNSGDFTHCTWVLSLHSHFTSRILGQSRNANH